MSSSQAFSLIRTKAIESLNLTIEEYEHPGTGAKHFHFASEHEENVFLVGLRTVPVDNTGVAHILEHTALCGSKRFDVRDPFFMMIRRSLNTFMNAFTSNDWTGYPFASLNKKDFNNLLDVYLDAVFFSNLNEYDFLQEGHRVEFEDNNPSNALTFKGVVFNEMKGAMSSVNTALWQLLCKHLFRETTYHYNSGGDPADIPDLTYDELLAFYRKHYHPGNAIFMTFGNIPAAEHQLQFEEKVLQHFEKSDDFITVEDEPRFDAPLRIEEPYVYDAEEDPASATHLIISWLLGKNTSFKDVLHAQLLSYVLLENSASPLQQFLETTELGTSPSALCGLEDSYRELVFVCGISGANKASAKAFSQGVFDVLNHVAEEGVPYERLSAILHQIELSQREIGGDSYPYGLQLMLAALPSAIHRGDPIELLNLDPVLDTLREDIKNPGFIKDLIRNLLIENTHRVELTAVADTDLSTQQQAAEDARLADIKAALSENDIRDIQQKTEALNARQAQVDDAGILPKVTLNDVPADIRLVEGFAGKNAKIPVTHYHQGTNGLVYQQIIKPLPALNEKERRLLPLYCQALTELGFNDQDYIAVQHLQSETVGSIHAYTTVKSTTADPQTVEGYFVISAKALHRNQAAMAELMKNTLNKVVFTESQRIRELVNQIRMRKEQAVPNNGHGLAITLATSQMSGLAAYHHLLSGMPSIQFYQELSKALNEQKKLDALCTQLKALHEKICLTPTRLLNICEKDRQSAIEQSLNELWNSNENLPTFFPFDLSAYQSRVKTAWITNTRVNFCAKAYPTVPADHADAAPLTVLGGFLRNGFLHTAIREKGGAYGAGASQDTNLACFKFFSYRDPRLTETLEDFDQSIAWLLEASHNESALEEAILGVISSLDKPGSPSSSAKEAYYNDLFGRTPEKRRAFRQTILGVTLEDLKRVAGTYLKKEKASVGVISHKAMAESIRNQGFEVHTL